MQKRKCNLEGKGILFLKVHVHVPSVSMTQSNVISLSIRCPDLRALGFERRPIDETRLSKVRPISDSVEDGNHELFMILFNVDIRFSYTVQYKYIINLVLILTSDGLYLMPVESSCPLTCTCTLS